MPALLELGRAEKLLGPGRCRGRGTPPLSDGELDRRSEALWRLLHTLSLGNSVFSDTLPFWGVTCYSGAGAPLYLSSVRCFMHRRPVNKRRSASKFRRSVGKTAIGNLRKPGRGGFRL